MTYDEFNVLCGALPAATYIQQWGGAHVWKVGGKVFAIGGWNGDAVAITFKASEIAWEVLRDRPGVRPAPYMASRGLRWLQHFGEPGLADAKLRDQLCQSHAMVAAALSRAARTSLGLS